jgi:hypothetical protein
MSPIVIALAIVVGIVSSARLTRLIAQESFPPVVRLRVWWDDYAEGHEWFQPWSKLIHCHWCLPPWVVLVVGSVGYFTNLHPVWWFINGWLAASYVASWIVHHDED